MEYFHLESLASRTETVSEETLGPMRLGMHFHTAHPDYGWLNRLHCLGVTQFGAERRELTCDVYAVH